MPRQANIRRNRRFASPRGQQAPRVNVQDRNLYFDNFRPQRRADHAGQFASALDDITRAMAAGRSGLFKDIKEEKERKGTIAGFLDIEIDAVPDEPEDLADRAKDAMAGKASTAVFKSKLDNLFTKAKDLPEDEFMLALQKTKTEFLKGQNRSFIEGFLPLGAEYEHKTIQSYYVHQDKLDTEDFLNRLGGVAQAELVSVNEQPLFDNQIKAEHLHTMVRNQQELAKQYKNLTKDQVNAKIIDSIGTLAVRSGRPDFLDFTMLKDKDGIAIWDTANKEAIARYVRQAESARDGMEREEQARVKLVQQESAANAQRFVIDALYSGDSRQINEAMLMVAKVKDFYTPKEYEHIHQFVSEIRAGDDYFANDSNPDVYTDLLVRADDNKLDLATLRNFKENLSRGDYLKVFERIQKANEKALKDKKAGGTGKSPQDKAFTDMRSGIGQELMLPGTFDETMNPMGTDITRRRSNLGKRLFAEYVEQRREEEGKLTWEALDWAKQKAIYMAYQQVLPRGGTIAIPEHVVDPDGARKPTNSKAVEAAKTITTGGKTPFADL